MKVAAIILARMSSKRFPGKHLAPLAGKPMIDHVVRGCSISRVHAVIVATSIEPADTPLAEYCQSRRIEVFRGSLNDPLERFRMAWETRCRGAIDALVRVTGDCPLISSQRIHEVIQEFSESGLDYLGYTNSPDGCDIEIMTSRSVLDADRKALPDEREHVTTWIRKNCKCRQVEALPIYGDVHYSVNTIEDLRTCEKLVARCGDNAHPAEYAKVLREEIYAVS